MQFTTNRIYTLEEIEHAAKMKPHINSLSYAVIASVVDADCRQFDFIFYPFSQREGWILIAINGDLPNQDEKIPMSILDQLPGTPRNANLFIWTPGDILIVCDSKNMFDLMGYEDDPPVRRYWGWEKTITGDNGVKVRFQLPDLQSPPQGEG